MSGAFTADMDLPAVVVQLNAMKDELTERFKANENDHQNLRTTIGALQQELEALKAYQSDLGGRLANVQQGLASTSDQARAVLETIVSDARRAFEEVRGEGLTSLKAAMEQHEAGLQALYTTLSDRVRFDLLGVRAELDAQCI